jgi:hypothetical protein
MMKGRAEKEPINSPREYCLSPFLTAIIVFYSRYKHQTLPNDRVHHLIRGFIILWFQVTTKDASP